MKPLEAPDSHHLLAAQGWLELGNNLEADKELDEIAPKRRIHPDVLEVRWHIYAQEKKWDMAVDIADAIITLTPEWPEGWNTLFARSVWESGISNSGKLAKNSRGIR